MIMKKNINVIFALAVGLGMAACGEKKAEVVTTSNGATVEVPATAHRYKMSERKAKKQPTEAVLTFDKSLTDAKGWMALADKEFEGNTAIEQVIATYHLTNIAPYAFAGCTNLTKFQSVELVDVVNDHAFEGCTSLKEFAAETRTVGISGFEGCTSLESFRMMENPYQIREGAFRGCTSLKSIIIGQTLTQLEEGAFDGCTALEEISFPFAHRKVLFGWTAGCTALQKVYLLSTDYFAFPESGKAFPCEQVTLYVPDEFLEKFKADASWKRFKEIVALSTSDYFDAIRMAK